MMHGQKNITSIIQNLSVNVVQGKSPYRALKRNVNTM